MKGVARTQHVCNTSCMPTTQHTATQTILHAETYRGVSIKIVETTYPDNGYTGRSARLDGRGFRVPAGTIEQAVAKLRATVDGDFADAEILPRLLPLVANTGAHEATTAPLAVDTVAWVYAMGAWRRGLVTATARTRTTVAYTTASSNGRVFRKAVAHGDVHI